MIEKIKKRVLIKCNDCEEEHNLFEYLDILTTDNIFLRYSFISNYHHSGITDFIPGQLKKVDIPSDFKEVHKIFVTPFGEGVRPIQCFTIILSKIEFGIISIKREGESYPEKYGASYLIYGNKTGKKLPLWTYILTSAKSFELENNFRNAIIECQTAFELFLTVYTKEKIRRLYSENIADYIYLSRRPRVEDLTKGIMKLAVGKTLPELLGGLDQDALYQKWKNGVNDKRNLIVHKGEDASKEEANEAFATIFKLVIFLDPDILHYFSSEMTTSTNY